MKLLNRIKNYHKSYLTTKRGENFKEKNYPLVAGRIPDLEYVLLETKIFVLSKSLKINKPFPIYIIVTTFRAEGFHHVANSK